MCGMDHWLTPSKPHEWMVSNPLSPKPSTVASTDTGNLSSQDSYTIGTTRPLRRSLSTSLQNPPLDSPVIPRWELIATPFQVLLSLCMTANQELRGILPNLLQSILLLLSPGGLAASVPMPFAVDIRIHISQESQASPGSIGQGVCRHCNQGQGQGQGAQACAFVPTCPARTTLRL
jgi:hypothetical protein